jgi:DNA modification methylase
MGNSKESDDEFLMHYEFFSKALYPLIKDGRNICVHIQNVSRSLQHHGRPGIWDIRGDIIRIFEKVGFWYYGEVTIWKNPQAQSIRTKAHALMFTQFIKDSLKSRPALCDYLMIFKKPGDSLIKVTGELQKNEYGAMERVDVTNDDWIEWASGIWNSNQDGIMLKYYDPFSYCAFNIKETNTLNARNAKSEEDEKHLCPLQLDLIERCVKLWSNPGETVFSPFAGIGSEGFQSILLNRKFVGIELKKEYYNEAIKNLTDAIEIKKAEQRQQHLF